MVSTSLSTLQTETLQAVPQGAVRPSMSESEKVRAVEHLFHVARDYRKPLVEQWTKNYLMVQNRTWTRYSHPYYLPKPEVPEIRPILSTVVGWMTDRRPELIYTPQADPHTDYHNFFADLAADLETVVQSIWHTHSFDAAVEAVLADAQLYGIGFFKTIWDAALTGGLGDPRLERVDPFAIYPDPSARASLTDANFIIHARRMSVLDIDRRWPGAARKLRTATETSGDVDEQPSRLDTDRGTAPRAYTSARPIGVGSASYGAPGHSRLHVHDDPGVVVYECWLREHRHEKDGDHITTVDEWRVVVSAGGRILMDERARDLWNSMSHPFVRFTMEEEGEFYPTSMTELLTPAQLSINRLLRSLEHNIDLTGDPILKADTRSGITRMSATNVPGRRIDNAPGSEVEWLQPPQMNSMVLPLIEFYVTEMERISGLYAMARGNIPSGRNSENVLDQIQEASFVRIRRGLRNLERALAQIGEQIAHLVVEFYDVPRIVQVVGPNHQKAALALKARHFQVPTEKGAVPMKFQIRAAAGSEEGLSRVARAQEADVLRAMGSIPIDEHLRMHGIRNAQEVAQKAMQEQAAGQPPPGARQRTRTQ